MISQRLGRYEILEEIGRGGMGTVYRGIDHQTANRVAIKHLRAETTNSETVERFQREGEILRRLNHPNIVQLLDALESNGQHYLIMEFIEGGSLRELLTRRQRLEIQQVLSLAIEIVDALTRAHHLNVIHRDIKPANVMLAADETPRLTDFGIARIGESDITKSGMILGTLNYISPEILQGKSADRSSDIWSFGVTLFEMLTGTLPFKGGESIGTMIHSILNEAALDIEALRFDIPIQLIDLTYRMLAKNPAERIPSFRLVGAELESMMQGRGSISSNVRMPAPQFDFTAPEHTVDNLPAQSTPFLGRTAEIIELKQLLNSQLRLITILAQGGMGKTRLSLEVAKQIQNRFPQGVYFVPLARIESAEYLVQTIAEELGLALSSQDDPKIQLLKYLKNAEMLLLLDNFEHLLEGAGLIQEILESAPGVKVLTTSRERLNLASEVLYNLSTMKIADWKSIDEALTYSSVQLFLQGAKRVRVDFALQQADVRAISRICRLVDGMPLGILLASAWVDTLSVDEIAGEIEKSIDFLETELRDVPERQRSIRSVLDSTWRRLDPSEQELFAALSVFRSSFTREAAQVVAKASLRGLAKLISKSLLTRDVESGRYHIHELLRQFAQQQLELSEQSSHNAREAHGAFFADFMQDRWNHLKDHRGKTALQEIHDDIENVRAAWHYWLERRDPGQLRKFFESLWLSHENWNWIRPAIDLFRDAGDILQKCESSSPELLACYAYVRANEAWFTCQLGLPQVGIEMARKSFEILRELKNNDNWFLPYSAFHMNGLVLNMVDEIMESSYQMVQDFSRDGCDWEESFGWIWVGYMEMLKGNFAEAQKKAEDGLVIQEKLQNSYGISVAAGIALGAALMAQGKFSRAKDAFMKGLAAAKIIDYRRLVQLCYDSLGTIALLEQNVDDAQSYFLKSLRITFESGQTREQLGALRDIATVYKLQDKLEKALELLPVILHHPAAVGQSSIGRRESLKDEAETLRAEIEGMLSPDSYARAWERGQSLQLDNVVAGILKDNQDPPTIEGSITAY